MKNLKIIVAILMIIFVTVSAVACNLNKVCEHADENLDHKCDLCSEAMGECADANKDHKCDYGCDKAFGTHKEADGSHSCAYCGAKISNCAPEADDGDCTTAILCTVCDAELTPAKTAHEAGEDDGDCTTAVKCKNCNQNAIAAEAAHVAGEDDGDCTTAVKCKNCNQNAIAAGQHIPNSDDGNCLTAIVCSTCGTETTPAKSAHVAGDDDGDCTTAVKCKNCNKNAIAAEAAHVAGADDNDCTTAVKCVNCEKNAVEAKSHNFEGEWNKDADGHWRICQNAGCNGTDTKAEHISSGAATETVAEKCTVCDFIITPELGHGHSYVTAKFDENNHWLECSCGEKSAVTSHIANEDDSNCTTAVTCQGCEYIMKAAEAEHKAGENSHNCAACGTKLSECADNNSDHDCDVCDKVLSTCEENYDEGKITTPATCTEKGVKTYTCTVCGETKTEDVSALGHTEETVAGKAATCTETGLTDGKKCSVCGDTTLAQKVIPAMHSYSSTLVVEGATTNYESGESFDTSKLVVKLDCANCDYTEDVSDYTLSKTDALQVEDTQITISYVKDEVTYAANVQITVKDSLAYPTEGIREVNILYKGDTAYSFMALDAAGNTDRAAAKGWFTPTVGTNVGLPTLMNPGANQYLQFNKTSQIELFFNKGSEGNTYHIFDNKTNWSPAEAKALFNKEYTYEFEVSANGAFVLSVCDFRTNTGVFANSDDLYGIQFLFDGNTIKMSRCSSAKVEAIATLEGVDFGDGTTRKISFAIVRQDIDNGKIRVFVDEEKAMFEATADYGSTTVSSNNNPGGKVVNGTLHFPDAKQYGQRFTVAPQILGDGYSTVNIYSYKKLFVMNYDNDNQYTVTLDGGLKFNDGSTTKVVDQYYDVFANVDLMGYHGLYNVNTGSIFYGLITADVTLGGYVKDANDVVPTLQQFATKGETGLAGDVAKKTNYIIAGRAGTRLTYTKEFTKDYKIRFCDTLANGQKFTGGVTYISTFTIKNYSDKQLSFTLYEITSGHTLTNFKTHVDLAPGESGTYTIEWSFAAANNMLPFIVFDNDHTGDNAGFDFGIALNVVEKK